MATPTQKTPTKKTPTKKTTTKKTATKKTATKKAAAKKTTKTKKKTTARVSASASAASSSSAAAAAPRFTPAARGFLRELARRQDRAWFAPRKEEFRALLEEPMKALLRALGGLLIDSFPAVEDATPKVFRIYRDTRFAKDKSPFKGHVAGQLSLGRVGLYVHVAPDEVFAAVGQWQMEPAALQAYRRALVDDDALGDALLHETRLLEQQGYALKSFDELSRAPAGVSPNHPRIQLLKHKGWAVALPVDGLDVDSASWPALLAERVRRTKTAVGLFGQALAG